MSNTASFLGLAAVINAITTFTQRHRVTEINQGDGHTKILFRDIIPERKEELGRANLLALEDSGDDGAIEPEDPDDGSIKPENLGNDSAIE
jgi:hypothetical protein